MFHQLVNAIELADAALLEIPRAAALYDACTKNRDFNIVQLLQYKTKALECFVVDVECDGVPSNNPYGIRYCERLAICVPRDEQALIEVSALRKDFPRLMHQNAVGPNSPASLCLYFEPAVAVRRNWTPENFLRRIQWWLEKSAKGELHPADQPVEQLFFVSKHELVLPWNYDELKSEAGQKFVISLCSSRPDGGDTFILHPARHGWQKGKISPIEIKLPPIVQGQIEPDPLTLGDLVDILHNRGTDFSTTLAALLQEFVGNQGVPADSDESLTVILLEIPICRELGGTPEKLATRAFAMRSGLLSLGKDLGVLVLHDGKYYRHYNLAGADVDQDEFAWRDKPLYPMDILQQLDSAAARLQSGIEKEGPIGVIVGVGSLGSSMLDMWGRSGWGQWSAIDKDHIKPHNLARHIAYAQHVGRMKTDVVAQLHDAVTDGASKVAPIVGDATNLNAESIQALSTATLVIDASTTLDYPRLASTRDDFGRHMSVFITPDGNAAVFLAEDESRSVRLRTLEAQYYRAIINNSWGEHHLDGNLGTFWSGASCRDISMVLPYSRVVVHAATLVDQVRLIASQPAAQLRVWTRDPESGAVQAHLLPTHQERRFDFGELTLFIDEGLVQKLHAERSAKAPKETGGILLGYHDFNIKAIVIVDALPAPADSKETVSSFERGTDGLQASVTEVVRRTADTVQYIGEWHSHPPGHSANPSGDDIIQLAYLSTRMAEDGVPAVSLIVGENDIQVMKGRA